jgi:O-antigen ligase
MSVPARARRETPASAHSRRPTGTLSFLAAIVYVIVEYLRPQERYGVVSGIPFGQVAGILLILACWVEQRRFPLASGTCIWIIALLLWLLVASLLGPYPSHSFVAWIDVLKLAVLAIFTAAALDTKERLYRYVIVVLLLYFLHTNFSFRGWVASGFSVGFRGMWVGSGPLRNPNDFGAALAAFWGISLAMIWADRAGHLRKIPKRWLHVVNTVLFVVAVIVSSSRGAALAFVAGAVFAAKRLGVLLRGLIVLSIFALLYYATASPEQRERYSGMGGEEDQTADERIETWKVALDVFEDHPVLGVGAGAFPLVAIQYSKRDTVFVQHNIYLQALTDGGLPGLLLLVGLLVSFFRDQRAVGRKVDVRARDPPLLPWIAFGLEVSMLSFMVAGFFITVLFYPFMWVLLGLSMATRQLAAAESTSQDRIPTSRSRVP